MLDVLTSLSLRQNACVHHVLNQAFVELIEVLLDLFKLRELLEQLVATRRDAQGMTDPKDG